MQKRALAAFATALTLSLIPALAFAAMAPYSQDFEGLVQTDAAALANDGWWVYGNVFSPEGDYLYGYGSFPAPNHELAFCVIAVGEGGDDQGSQQLSVFSDYENGDHANGNLIESNVFHEQVVGPDDIGGAWVFQFQAKRGNIEGETTAAAFIKTLDPSSGYETTNFITVDMTDIPDIWGGYTIYLNMDPTLEGQLFQFGFTNTATNYEGSGIFYDNILFFETETIDVPETPAYVGADLRQNYPNPFNPETRIAFIVERAGPVDLAVFDTSGRRVATLLNGEMAVGEYAETWRGFDDAGRPVSSGRYFYVLRTSTGSVARSMTLLK